MPTGPLTAGQCQSCGCLRFDATATLNGASTRYPLTYRSWAGMLARCQRDTATRFEDWGGRGITVCARWQSFENFLADMGECPTGYSIERRDNDGGYAPENCVWLKKGLQARNRRTTRWITVNGVTASLAEHAERAGVNYKWAWRQIVYRRMPPESVLRRPC